MLKGAILMSIILYKDGQQKRLDNQGSNIDYSELLDFFYPVRKLL